MVSVRSKSLGDRRPRTRARGLLVTGVAIAVLASSCEIEATDPETGAPIIERVVGAPTTTTTVGPGADTSPIPGTHLGTPPSIEAPPPEDAPPAPVVPMPTTPDNPDAPPTTAPAPGDTAVGIFFANNSERVDPAPLDNAMVNNDIHVFAVTNGVEPVRMEWLINDSVYRTDDLYSPFDLVPEHNGLSGRLPVDELGGGTHTVTARAVLATSDGSETGEPVEVVLESVTFQVDAAPIPTTVPPTTTVAPGPTTTVAPAPTTTTTPPASPGTPACAPTSSAQVGWRGAGVAESALTPMEGPVVLGDNAVLENFDVSGHIEIAGDNVVIRNGRIRGNSSTPYWGGLIDVRGDNALIEYVELDGAGEAANGVYVHDHLGGGYTARHLDLHGLSADAFKALGDTELYGIFAHDRNGLVTSAHADVLQLQNWRADGKLTITCSNMDWGIPNGYGPSDVQSGSISGGQGIWIADYWLQDLEIRDSRIISVGYTLGLKIDTRMIMCNVHVGSDMGWGGVHPSFESTSATTAAWSVWDDTSGAAITPIATVNTNC